MLKRICVCVSGNGSNLQAILNNTKSLCAIVPLVVSNKKSAYALERARLANIDTMYRPFLKDEMSREEYDRKLARDILSYSPDLVVLAGWMHIFTDEFLKFFPNKVINLHPALPGKFPGKDAIKEAYNYYKQNPSDNMNTGVMVHKVIPELDAGETISSLQVQVYQDDTLEELRERVQHYEKQVLLTALHTLVDGKKEKDFYRGKVRNVYTLNDKVLAMVQSNRQSAFDRHICEIPNKGSILTKTSEWWFNKLDNVPHHFLFSDRNVMFVKKCKVIPIEMVIRSYMTGSTKTSLWTHYNNGSREYTGNKLREGYTKNEKLDETIITPTTKGVEDVPITGTEIVKRGIVTQEQWDYICTTTRKVFEYGQKVADERGLILVDTKYEFGFDENGDILLIDEVHTCDSSRFWLKKTYQERFNRGEEPERFDKDVVRTYIRRNCDDPYKKLPAIPDSLIDRSQMAYMKFYKQLTGETVLEWGGENEVKPETTNEELMELYSKFVPTTVILSGSVRDKEFVDKLKKSLKNKNMNYFSKVCSAHKNTKELLEFLQGNEFGTKVYITVAGRSNALSGVVACNSKFPVIACPPHKDKMDMSININSTLQCPSNVPVMTVLDPNNAIQCVERIISLE